MATETSEQAANPNDKPSAARTAATAHMADIIEQNILCIARLREEAASAQTTQDRLADRITTFAGSMRFVYVHVVWFILWVLVNSGALGTRPFDPFPYGLLTMVVSLEAIFLSTFVLVSQNRLAEVSERQAHLDLQIGLLTEHEVTRVLRMLDAIQDHLGIDNSRDMELAQLETETHPDEVLAEIVRVERHKAPDLGPSPQ